MERFLKYASGNNTIKVSIGDSGDILNVFYRLIPIETKDSEEIRYRITFLFSYPSSFDDSGDYDDDGNIKNFNKENSQPKQLVNLMKRIITEKREDSEFNNIIKELLDTIPEDPSSFKDGTINPFGNYRPPHKIPLRDIYPKSIERWGIDRITFVGDAIHAMNPILGLGTSNAIRDADLLAQSLLYWD